MTLLSRRVGQTRRRKSQVLALLLVPLLGVLLVLQARWLEELAAAQHEVTSRMLETAAVRMAKECQATLSEIEESVLAGRVERDPVAAALVAEVVALEDREDPPTDRPAFVVRDREGTRRLVVLDQQRLETALFPALARSALGPDGLETYVVTVASVSGAAPPLYRSHAATVAEAELPDASAALRLVPDRWRVLFGDSDNRWTEVAAPVWVSDGKALGAPVPAPAPWRIELRHRAGSLEVALARARLHNLLLSGGLLALVVAGLALLWRVEQRARRLAEKELALVAGVSHELKTPLTVVRTAASNLGRGVVKDPAQVADYGQLIEREATRVSALVERVLRSASTEAPLVLEDVDLEAVIDEAVERCQPWRDRKRFEVAVEVAADARRVRADGAALVSALHNLIENAVKYGGDGQTIRVDVRRGADIVVEVADDGPGVAAEDRAHLFEPFYRGAVARGGNTPGSGLGLGVARAIAVAHGGRLELLATDSGARGATFALHLPPPLGSDRPNGSGT